MARRGIPEAEQHLRAVQAARRMIAKGERPSYRLVIAQSSFDSVAWSLIGLPGVVGIAPGGRAPDAARATIAAVLEVPADTFDLLT